MITKMSLDLEEVVDTYSFGSVFLSQVIFSTTVLSWFSVVKILAV